MERDGRLSRIRSLETNFGVLQSDREMFKSEIWDYSSTGFRSRIQVEATEKNIRMALTQKTNG